MDQGIKTAIGLMSGTSLDGCDAALIRSDGEKFVELGPAICVPYSPATRTMVTRATKAALEGRKTASDIEDAQVQVTMAQIAVVQELLSSNNLTTQNIDIIGFHGQTILHRPPLNNKAVGASWQLGDGRLMADRLGIPVINDFRAADMALGGQGAPLVPAYHSALVAATQMAGHPVVVVNIGGVANVTYVPGNDPREKLIAFDCGPGNGLIDQWVEKHTGKPMDEGGMIASSGQVNESALRLMCLNPFIKQKPPKSLDRYDFKTGPIEELSLEDATATLTAFTAECIARSLQHMPSAPSCWVICGGGRHNPVLMEQLKRRIEQQVLSAEEVGWRGDYIEAECFGYLAIRSLKGLPNSYPDTTGVLRPTVGGVLHRPLGYDKINSSATA